MSRLAIILTLAALSTSSATFAEDATQVVPEYDAILKTHAQLPAQSFVLPPKNAPLYFNQSGRFTAKNNHRINTAYGIYDDATQLARPFPGQPLQGFSGIRSLGDNRFLVLTDNGFGTKANSPDAMLMFHEVKADWESGRVIIEKTTFLSDPNNKVPFPIIDETGEQRYLTGADFDIESIQPVNDGYWFGDEFGPWLLKTDKSGIIQSVIATQIGETLYTSPDNAFVKLADPDKAAPSIITKRSGGYEGMAISRDGKTLYPMLEKPIYDTNTAAAETVNGQPVLRILAFDNVQQQWLDSVRYYPLAAANHAIGDFNMIDAHRALIIERDGGQGDPREGWASNPAQFKRIYLIDLRETDEKNVLRKIAYIDLMKIKDPNQIAPRGTQDSVFSFPFVTIEDIDIVDKETIIVANDNNYPFSVGRQQGRADDNEFIQLNVADFLKAK
ncbi:MAG: esterase-like activity of phytase family protein [Pseudomonadales bacterium]